MPSKRTDTITVREIGHVDRFFTGIAKVRGLPGAFLHETLVTEDGDPCALVVGFTEEHVEAVFFDDAFDAERPVYRSERLFEVPVSDEHVGRVIDGLGRSRDAFPEVPGDASPVFREAPPIIARDPVVRPLITGVKMIDAILPLGRGQRELIIGDRRVGKSTLATDAVLHQRHADSPVTCVYVMCGHKARRVHELVSLLDANGALSYTTVVAATADDTFAAQYLAPFVGCAIAEHFRDTGRDVLVIYDDLSKHAKTYRDISLLLGRAPGRETYPADIFSLHAVLLERAAQLSEAHGSGSLTALPIVETQEEDLTSYIPTNLISITDGQIYLERGLKERGFMPAINAGLSVSRLGAEVQSEALKKMTGGLRLALAQQHELQRLTQLETVVSEEAKKRIHRGELILELLKQEKRHTVRWEEQVVLFSAVESGAFDDLTEAQWRRFESLLLDVLRQRHAKLLMRIRTKGFTDATERAIGEAVAGFKEEFLQR